MRRRGDPSCFLFLLAGKRAVVVVVVTMTDSVCVCVVDDDHAHVMTMREGTVSG